MEIVIVKVKGVLSAKDFLNVKFINKVVDISIILKVFKKLLTKSYLTNTLARNGEFMC